MGKKIVDAKADKDGDITAVRFEGNGSFTPIETAIDMADKGQIDNAHVVRPENGRAYLRTNPDDETDNNLDDMV